MSNYAAFIIFTDQAYGSSETNIIMNLTGITQHIEKQFWSWMSDTYVIGWASREVTCSSTGISFSASTFTYFPLATQPSNYSSDGNRPYDLRPRKIIGILK